MMSRRAAARRDDGRSWLAEPLPSLELSNAKESNI